MIKLPPTGFMLKSELFFTVCDVLVFLGLYPAWKHKENMIDFIIKIQREYPDFYNNRMVN